MRNLGIRASLVSVTLAALAFGGANALHSAHAQQPAAAPVYAPSIADLMTGSIQTRHAKLALAVRARNWTYAAYEVRELRGAFNRITRTFPQYEGQDTATLMTMAKAPVDNLEAAIKAKDAKSATDAFATLTETCNNCHTSIKRSYIHIQTPIASMFPNQDFAPRLDK